jgi:TP901 family phage tail tape measure protein
MSNGVIDKIVDQASLDQLLKLQQLLNEDAKSMQQLIAKAAELRKELGSVTSMGQLNEQLEKQATLNREVAAENKKHTQTMSEVAKLQERLAKLSSEEAKQVAKLRQEIADRNRELRNSAREELAASGSIEKMRAKLIDMRREYDNLSKAIRNSPAGKQMASDIRAASEELLKLEQATGRSQRNVGNYMSALAGLGKGLLSSLGVVTGITLLFRTIGSGVKTIKDFEQANANLASILGKNREEIEKLTNDAKQLGATTEYTASQITTLQTELAKLGFNENQIINMTKPISQFATALDANLGDAASVAGAALRAFHLDSRETERVVSAMAAGANKSALDFNYFANAMSTISPVANAFNFTIEDTVALLGTLADSGFDASTAATATRNILLNLADGSGKLAKALGQPVKSLDDLVPALVKLRSKGIDLNETLELTDKRSVAAFNTFLTNAESVTKLRDAVTGANDELKKMQEARMNTLEGSTKLLSSAWEGLVLSFSNSTGVFKWVIDALTGIVTAIKWAVDTVGDAISDIRGMFDEEFYNDRWVKNFKNNLDEYVRTSLDNMANQQKTITSFQEATKGLAKEQVQAILNANPILKKLFAEVEKTGIASLSAIELEILAVNNQLKAQQGILDKYRADGVDEQTISVQQEGVRYLQDQLKVLEKQRDVEKEINREAAAKKTKEAAEEAAKKAKERADNELKLRKKVAKAEEDLAQLKSKKEVEELQKIANSENASYDTRMEAAKAYADARIAEATRIAGKEVEEAEGVQALIDLAQEKKSQAIDKANTERTDMEVKAAKDRATKIAQVLEEQVKQEVDALGVQQAQEEAALAKKYVAGSITREQYEQGKLDIANEYALKVLQVEIDLLQNMLDTEELTAEQRIAITKQLADAKVKLTKAAAEQEAEVYDKSKKDQEDNEKELAELRKKLVNETVDLIKSSIASNMEARIAEYDQQIEQINTEKDTRLAALDEMGMSEARRAAETQRIEEEAAAKTKQLEEEKRQAEMRKARYEKAQAIVETAINTGVAIMASAKMGFPLAIPFVAMAAALGTVQLAAIVAQKPPQYKEGTDFHSGGLAILGDGGVREGVILPSGKAFASADIPTLYDLPRGTKVLPDIEQLEVQQAASTAVDLERIEKMQAKTIQAIQNNKAVLSVNLDARGIWSTVSNNTIRNMSMSSSFVKK